MRISRFVLAPVCLVAACAPQSGAPDGESVECAFGESALGADCVLEAAGEGFFTIHHPDDSFQRIRIDPETGAVTAADGADEIAVEADPSAGTVEFAIGSARYRIKRGALVSPSS
ncbi:MAG: hypothetical protein AAF251_00675 [Pseudomonadota bacterium]